MDDIITKFKSLTLFDLRMNDVIGSFDKTIASYLLIHIIQHES
jgi:hypothetical protein